jgi:hypothetical protein
MPPHGHSLSALKQSRARYKAHNLIRDVVLQCALLAGIKGSASVPPLCERPHDQRRADAFFPLSRSFSRSRASAVAGGLWHAFVADISLLHPRLGATADRSLWGSWDLSKIDARIAAKNSTYAGYNTQQYAFIPMVTDTYQFMGNDLLRFLWFLAEAKALDAVKLDLLGDNPLDVTRLWAARMQSRVACAIAIGTARRLLGSYRCDSDCRSPAAPGPLPGRSAEEPLFPS